MERRVPHLLATPQQASRVHLTSINHHSDTEGESNPARSEPAHARAHRAATPASHQKANGHEDQKQVPARTGTTPGQPDSLKLITDKGFAGKKFERSLRSEHGITLPHPSRKKEILRAGEPMLKKVRQLIESINDTLKGQLDLEQHGGRTMDGVAVRVAQRILALAAAIWHNFQIGQPINRSLTAHDH